MKIAKSANIAKEKQEEISKLLEAHQQDKENICREFTEKQEVIEQEYIKVTDDLQKQVELLKEKVAAKEEVKQKLLLKEKLNQKWKRNYIPITKLWKIN